MEKKGWHGHSLSERQPQPLPGQAFIVFLGTLHQDGPHLLCTGLLRVVTENKREDVANYIKEGYLQMEGKKWLNWLHSSLGGLA